MDRITFLLPVHKKNKNNYGQTFKTYNQIPTSLACDHFNTDLSGNNITFDTDSIILLKNNSLIQMLHIWPANYVQVTWHSTDRKRLASGQMKAGKPPCMRLTHPLPTLHCSSITSMRVSRASNTGKIITFFLYIYFTLHACLIKHPFRFETADHLYNYYHDWFQDGLLQWAANLWLSLPLFSILTVFNPCLLSSRRAAEEGPYC